MLRLHARRLSLLCIAVLTLLSALPITAQPPPVAAQEPIRPPQCQEDSEEPGQDDGGNLDDIQLTAAFAEVVADDVYQGYRFPIRSTPTTDAPPMLPILLKSIAGIESDWLQYKERAGNLRTTLGINQNPPSCDYGIMQVNDRNSAALFNRNPSLRSDTRANIAAGAEVLSEKWNSGIVGPLPLVNGADPERLIDWYYALSSYNSGPAANWRNNPNCGTALFCGNDRDYGLSRNPENAPWQWRRLARKDYPYQELVLYNMQFPRWPDPVGNPLVVGAQWVVGELGLQETTWPADYGIRPDDALFLNAFNQSTHPNLLLFHHRASEVNTNLRDQFITFEYDLPMTATVTLEILDSRGVVLETLPSDVGHVGWNRISKRVQRQIYGGYRYRIRAEAGSANEATTWYLGQYVQQFSTSTPPGPQLASQAHIYLPLILHKLAVPTSRVGENLLRNSTFEELEPDTLNQPRYWEVQSILSREQAVMQRRFSDYTFVLKPPSAPGLVFKAAPAAREEVSQRVDLRPGTYRLTFDLIGAGNPNSLLQVRVRPAGPSPAAWSTVVDFPIPWQGSYTAELAVEGPISLSFLASFTAPDGASVFVVQNVELRPLLNDIGPVHVAGSE